tara:strand:- start:690 stop:1274 length:585 start_codon:yes stop_codon:yes gene_type:complete
MGDKELYLKAEVEFSSDSRDRALWSKSLTLNSGDEEKAKYTYINLRVEELSNQNSDKPKNILKNNPLNDGYSPSNTSIVMKIIFTIIAFPIVPLISFLLFGNSNIGVNFAVGALCAVLASIWWWELPNKKKKENEIKQIEDSEDINATESKKEKELESKEKTIPEDKFDVLDSVFWACLIIGIFLGVILIIRAI